MPKITSGVYRANTGFVVALKSGNVRVPEGSVVPYDFGYDVIDGREELFTDVSQPRSASVVEQATAAPGEKRLTKRKN